LCGIGVNGMNTGIEKAINAYKIDITRVAESNSIELMRRDDVALKLFEGLGLNPSWVRNGGEVYFADVDVLFQVGVREKDIFRVGKCPKCGERLLTNWGRSANLENIGSLIEDPDYGYHFCQNATPESPLSPAEDLLRALDRYIEAGRNES
jgi:hypothetical protein